MDWSVLLMTLLQAVNPYVVNFAFFVVLGFILWQLRISVSSGVRREERLNQRVEKLEALNTDLKTDLSDLQRDYLESVDACQGIQARLYQMQQTLQRINVFAEDSADGADDEDSTAIERYLRAIVSSVREDLVRHQSEACRSAVWQLDSEDRTLRMLAGSGFTATQERGLQLEVDRSIAGTVIRTGRPRITGSARTEPDYQHIEESQEFESLVCVPVRSRQEVVGVLTVDGRQKDLFDQHDQLVAEAYAAMVGISLVRHSINGR